MDAIHENNIAALIDFVRSGKGGELLTANEPVVSYFRSGGGNHLYLIECNGKKFLARVNFYFMKNEWKVKQQEFDVLRMISDLGIAPQAYYLDAGDGILGQHFIVIEYIDGKPLAEIADAQVVHLSNALKKLHTAVSFEKSGDTFPPNNKLPYRCNIFNEFANGEDKRIEKYQELPGIEMVIEPYKRIVQALGDWFCSLTCFADCHSFCLCHADLKKENILETPDGAIFLIDWECAASDILETDIGRLFAGCAFTESQQELFLSHYFSGSIENRVRERIMSIKIVLDFFRIIEDYILLKRKDWDAKAMLHELVSFEAQLKKAATVRST